MNTVLNALRSFFSIHALAHPKTTFSSALTGVVAITQSQADWETLLGHAAGARVFVLAKWFGAACMAVAAAGRSVIPAIDNPVKPPEPPGGSI